MKSSSTGAGSTVNLQTDFLESEMILAAEFPESLLWPGASGFGLIDCSKQFHGKGGAKGTLPSADWPEAG